MIVLLWAVAVASIYTQALLRESDITFIDLAAVAVVCLLAGAAMGDIGDALVGYIASTVLSLGATFLMATIPLSIWTIPSFTGSLLTSIWAKILFRALFPFAFIIYLVASIIGSALGERFVQ